MNIQYSRIDEDEKAMAQSCFLSHISELEKYASGVFIDPKLSSIVSMLLSSAETLIDAYAEPEDEY